MKIVKQKWQVEVLILLEHFRHFEQLLLDPGCCENPRATSRALYLSMEPSDRVLILNTYLLLIIFILACLGTKVQVLLL
jgi:hypothetical protein